VLFPYHVNNYGYHIYWHQCRIHFIICADVLLKFHSKKHKAVSSSARKPQICHPSVFISIISIALCTVFQRLDIRGRIKVLHGQNRKTEEPPLALFAICTPFGPPSLLEIPQKEVMFKSKHKLDLSLVSMDQR
jgi:hypothetical protein